MLKGCAWIRTKGIQEGSCPAAEKGLLSFALPMRRCFFSRASDALSSRCAADIRASRGELNIRLDDATRSIVPGSWRNKSMVVQY